MNVLVDSNIVIYSLTKQSSKNKGSQNFLITNRNILFLSHQVILESMRVLTHQKFANPMSSAKALEAVWNIAEALRIVAPNIETIALVKELISKYKITSNRIFDAYLVATAMTNDINIIATDNTRDFKKYEEIKILNPFV